jgi:hypothetical protein
MREYAMDINSLRVVMNDAYNAVFVSADIKDGILAAYVVSAVERLVPICEPATCRPRPTP